MPDLSPCMRLVVRMPQADQDEVVARVDAYANSGIPAAQAQRMAVADLIAEIDADEKELRALAEAKQPVAVPVAAPAPATLALQASLPEEPAPEAGPGFYSALRRELANAKTNASPAEYWRNLIKGAVSKGLVKADEVQWSGVNDWLDSQPGKVSKISVLDHLDLNGARVEETVLGGPREKADTRAMEDALVTRAEQLQAEGNDAHSIDMLIRGESADRIYRQMRNDIGMVPADFARDIQNWYTALVDSGDEHITKYGQYTLPGGTNYREVLLTLPERRPLTEYWRDMADRYGDDDPRTVAAKKAARAEAGMNAPKPYKSNHWGQPNVLAHIRVNDRVDSDGKRVLFVEEIQSDWGSETRKQREAIAKAVDSDFNGIVDRMKQAGVLEVVCD